MQHATVNALCTGRSGTMWIGTHDGLFGGTVNGPMVRISHPMVDHIKIMAIVEDRNGTIWVGGDNGLIAFSPESVTPDNRITDLALRFRRSRNRQTDIPIRLGAVLRQEADPLGRNLRRRHKHTRHLGVLPLGHHPDRGHAGRELLEQNARHLPGE